MARKSRTVGITPPRSGPHMKADVAEGF
ncbi:uncharacterized protein G2W53_033521 [Senna tora]|uniref:Uncharacterized protein n=1 Tax=Senna tora TaxID=362788 RepID=A0A834SYF4_9FABA|nr:uncharacterized protein G2W53_033521 [Senna tora]